MKRYKEIASTFVDKQHGLNNDSVELGMQVALDDTMFYQGELGAIYSVNQTEFKVWAPTAQSVELVLYDGYYGKKLNTMMMTRLADNATVYSMILQGDQHGTTYKYRLTFPNGEVKTSVDPYSRAVTVNGRRSVVVDLQRLNPTSWSNNRMVPFDDKSKAIIYEMHVRDFSVSETSGIVNKGKFLGVIETGTLNPQGSVTGLDYLTKLGVTHVQLLPIFDYATVDETPEKPYQYNWGYDPLNYNVPEGSYSTNPYDPFNRITELKEMIQGLHDAGIRVIMDVVYNHVYEVENHSLERIVPGYYFRRNPDGTLSNGTGVGNDTASEQLMMRKYMIDSIVYWATEYHIDGFRFDLMGIHDIETMQTIRESLDKIDPSIILYGEGWDLNTPLEFHRKAIQGNAKKIPQIGFFNDAMRNNVKGSDFGIGSKGFVSGEWYVEGKVANSFLGEIESKRYDNPLQVVQYVACHDNQTLYDKIKETAPLADIETLVKYHELATSIILLSQGMPFIHAGQEFLRTKNGLHNSYNQPDDINQIDWLRQDEFEHTVTLVRDLITLRQSEPLLRQSSYDMISKSAKIYKADYQILEIELKNDTESLFIILNGQENNIDVQLPKGDYIIKLFDGKVYADEEISTGITETIQVPAHTAMVLKQYHYSSTSLY